MPWAAIAATTAAGAIMSRRRERYQFGWAPPSADNDSLHLMEYQARCAEQALAEKWGKPFDYHEWKRKWDWMTVRTRVLDKEKNMSTRLERRRTAIQAKWRARLKWSAWIVFGTPIALGVLSVLWRLAVQAIVG